MAETTNYLKALATDEARLREVAARDLTAPVPTCPEWAVSDLVRHVALVYLHKVECVRYGAPRGDEDETAVPWPPRVEPQPPLALLDQTYAALINEFTRRSPEQAAISWYAPDQTVAFWIRRMTHETVIHRVDAELAVGEPVSAVPDGIATDGIDEVLTCFLAYGTRRWPGAFGPALAEADGTVVLVETAGQGWLVRMDPAGVRVDPVAAGSNAGAAGRVSGDPQSVLLWLWRRTEAGAVTYDGDPLALGRLRDLLAAATQ